MLLDVLYEVVALRVVVGADVVVVFDSLYVVVGSALELFALTVIDGIVVVVEEEFTTADVALIVVVEEFNAEVEFNADVELDVEVPLPENATSAAPCAFAVRVLALALLPCPPPSNTVPLYKTYMCIDTNASKNRITTSALFCSMLTVEE